MEICEELWYNFDVGSVTVKSGVIEVIENDKRIALSSNIEIYTWFSSYRHTTILPCWNISLLERMVVHKHFIYSNVFRWNCNDV